MKNILFATTALVATAGIAAADVSLSGAANVGIINDGTAGAETDMYQNMSITATMSGETDGGLTFGATLSVRNGDDVDLDVGDLGDNTSGAIAPLSATSFGSVFVSGDFGTITFDRDGIDNVHNDDFSHDVSYAYSAGALSVTVTADIDNDGAAYADGEEFAAKVVYSAAPVTVTVATDDSGEADATLAYALNDMIGLSVNFDTDGQGAESETIVKATYANGGISAHLALADDDDDQWEIGLGYTAGALTLGAVFAENDGAGDTEMDITASYDLGGGMAIKAATNESGAYFVGTALAF